MVVLALPTQLLWTGQNLPARLSTHVQGPNHVQLVVTHL